jgi:hypothetical protein
MAGELLALIKELQIPVHLNCRLEEVNKSGRDLPEAGR